MPEEGSSSSFALSFLFPVALLPSLLMTLPFLISSRRAYKVEEQININKWKIQRDKRGYRK